MGDLNEAMGLLATVLTIIALALTIRANVLIRRAAKEFEKEKAALATRKSRT